MSDLTLGEITLNELSSAWSPSHESSSDLIPLEDHVLMREFDEALVDLAAKDGDDRRLEEILGWIRTGRAWDITVDDARILLQRGSSDVPRRLAAKFVSARRPCAFFVDASSKKRKPPRGSAFAAADEDDEETHDVKFSGNPSATVTPIGGGFAVVRLSGSVPENHKQQFGDKTVGHWRLVIVPDNPEYDHDPSEVMELGRARRWPWAEGEVKAKCKRCGGLVLISSMPSSPSTDARPSASAGPSAPRSTCGGASTSTQANAEGEARLNSGDVVAMLNDDLKTQGDLSVGGSATIANGLTVGEHGEGMIRGTLVSGRGDHAEFMRRYDDEEELNSGDVVALVGDDADGVQKASRSARGCDGAEWRVVTTEPQVLGFQCFPPEEEHLWVPLVFSGQVKVGVVDNPPVDSYLVPSGREDGKARAWRPDEKPLNVLGQVVDAKKSNGRVLALVQKGMGEAPMNRYLQRQLDLMRGENERLRERTRTRGRERAQPRAERARAQRHALHTFAGCRAGATRGAS